MSINEPRDIRQDATAKEVKELLERVENLLNSDKLNIENYIVFNSIIYKMKKDLSLIEHKLNDNRLKMEDLIKVLKTYIREES